jgi:hypothetical protein
MRSVLTECYSQDTVQAWLDGRQKIKKPNAERDVTILVPTGLISTKSWPNSDNVNMCLVIDPLNSAGYRWCRADGYALEFSPTTIDLRGLVLKEQVTSLPLGIRESCAPSTRHPDRPLDTPTGVTTDWQGYAFWESPPRLPPQCGDKIEQVLSVGHCKFRVIQTKWFDVQWRFDSTRGEAIPLQ